MPERNAYDALMGFFGQDAESVISGRQEDPVTGKPKATFVDTLFGRSQAELDSAYDTMKTTQRRKKGATAFEESPYQSELRKMGIDPEKTSVGAINSAVREIQETKAADLRTEGFQQTLAPLQMQMQQNSEQFNATMQRQMANDAKAHQLQLMQFAESKEQRADELEYQKMRDRKADMQYNERLEQLDRKDRRQGISSLAAGLAALGAAFAL